MIAGLLMAVGCALAGSVGMLLKQRGAVAAPTVLARHPVRSAVNLFGSKWWTMEPNAERVIAAGRLKRRGCAKRGMGVAWTVR